MEYYFGISADDTGRPIDGYEKNLFVGYVRSKQVPCKVVKTSNMYLHDVDPCCIMKL